METFSAGKHWLLLNTSSLTPLATQITLFILRNNRELTSFLLKVLLLPGNVSYIGLSSADPEYVEKLISEDKKVSRNVKTGFGFFEWRERIAQRKQLEHDKLIDRLRREDAAETEICELDEDDDLVKKTHEVNRKHGLL